MENKTKENTSQHLFIQLKWSPGENETHRHTHAREVKEKLNEK